jgi:preprotein translocase subunit Sec61beta
MTLLDLIFVVWISACFAGMVYFWNQKNIRMRKKLLPLLIIAIGILVFILIRFDSNANAFLILPTVGVAILYTRWISICDNCGAVVMKIVRNPLLMWTRRKSCPKCGAALDKKNA